MLDAYGDIATRNEKEPTQLIIEADLSSLYSKPLQWERYEEIVDEQFKISCINSGVPFNDEEAWKLNEDPIRMHILDVNLFYEPEVFDAVLNDNV